ncbi:hypothetical protein [Halarchaeum nitratireducens]|nr:MULTISPECIES: hypothetical protein [Halarchaeum]MBP2252032.1 hypothetical protein [Halarchaeum solikamskense]
MPELDIGASQAEYIEELREALADEYLDGYGAMRPRDALQYLIDRHEATRPADALVPDANGDADAGEPDGSSGEPAAAGSDTVDTSAGSTTVETVRRDADATSDDADSTTRTDPSPSPSGSESPLRQMMELLEEHDDAWEEVDSSDGKYRVTLPDGSTAHARTRDDVRALLFKHYR